MEISLFEATNLQIIENLEDNSIPWDMDVIEEACRRAGLLDRLRDEEGEDFERVAYDAIEILKENLTYAAKYW